MSQSTDVFGIIDSHIHLYAASHIPSLAWSSSLPANHALNRQNSVSEYKLAADPTPSQLYGFVFLETDRKSGLDETQWSDVLDEVDYLLRIAIGSPVPGEGHDPNDRTLVLGIIPWAPLPAGVATISKFVDEIRTRFSQAGESTHLLKGFRYLVQDKPPGTMLEPNFIESLVWLSQQPEQFTFDLGVDARSGGLDQLREAVEMFQRLEFNLTQSSSPQQPHLPKIIINHFCKPNLRLSASECQSGHPEFVEWSDLIRKMATYSGSYMKLSGFFSEIPPSSEEDGFPENKLLLQHVKPWLDVVFGAFGPERIMFGSDWPVCNAGGPGIERSWRRWFDLITAILEDLNLDTQQKARIWAGTAAEAYAIPLPERG